MGWDGMGRDFKIKCHFYPPLFLSLPHRLRSPNLCLACHGRPVVVAVGCGRCRVRASSASKAQAEVGNLCDPDPQRSNPQRSSVREHQTPQATLQAQARPQYLLSMVPLLLLLVHPSPFSSSSRLPQACFTWHSDPNYFATKTLVFYLNISSNIYCNRSSVPESKRTMFEPQHFVDLHENSGFGDQNSWLSGEVDSSSTNCRIQSSLSNSAANGNMGHVLYNDLVEMIPLVQSLIITLSLSLLKWICI
ncbi:hypothetical protein SLEP1_g33854 [Rubroshorea leprosula]|uniref:Uncharacterized protein n=1 Tax=Rubroshorea leprosula TaxID=152421 RepID=A0AAV5KHX5_9ROSI|nr:hypothetical protein SLEP1_g33854 [Rubroshorea leprosula]